MPDLPLDTLVIIGLVLASLIGRIFQKKQDPEKGSAKAPTSQPSDSGPTLDEVLKKAFGEPDIVEEFEYEELVAADQSGQREQPEELDLPPPSSPEPIPTSSLQETPEEPIPARSPGRRARRELFAEGGSLRKAFVLKEILDKPVSLRTSR
jgi:hypothetical protein